MKPQRPVLTLLGSAHSEPEPSGSQPQHGASHMQRKLPHAERSWSATYSALCCSRILSQGHVFRTLENKAPHQNDPTAPLLFGSELWSANLESQRPKAWSSGAAADA